MSTNLRLLEPREPKVDHRMVEVLEDFVRQAKTGSFTGYAIVLTHENGEPLRSFAGKSLPAIIGGLEVLKAAVIAEFRIDEVAKGGT